MFDVKQFLPRCIPRRTHTRTTSVLTAPAMRMSRGTRIAREKLQSNFDKKTNQKERSGNSGCGCGLAHAPPAVHFAVFRYPQRNIGSMQYMQVVARLRAAPHIHHTRPGARGCTVKIAMQF